MEFQQSGKKAELISKFSQFKVAIKRLESSESYLSCQRRLLNQEISIKYKTIRTFYNKIKSTKATLHNEMSFIDYLHGIKKLLVLNDKNISNIHKN